MRRACQRKAKAAQLRQALYYSVTQSLRLLIHLPFRRFGAGFIPTVGGIFTSRGRYPVKGLASSADYRTVRVVVMVNAPNSPFRKHLLAAAFAAALAYGFFADGPVPAFEVARAAPGSGSDGAPEDDIEDDIEDALVEGLEDAVDDAVEDRIGGEIENSVEDSVESDIEDSLEDTLADSLEDSIEEDVIDKSGPGGGDLEDEIEDAVEEKIKSDVEDKSGPDEKFEDEIEDRIDDEVEDRSGPSGGAEDGVDGDVAAEAEEDAEDRREDEDSKDDDPEALFDNSGSGSFSSGSGSQEEQENAGDGGAHEDESAGENGDEDNSGSGSSNSGRNDDDDEDEESEDEESEHNEPSRDAVIESFELDFDDDGNAVIGNEWLVLINADALAALSDRGYAAQRVKALNSLDLILARITPPESVSFKEASNDIAAVAPDAEIDYNHLYRAEGASERNDRPEAASDIFDDFRLPDGGAAVTIGLVDTRIDVDHPALADAAITSADFVPYDAPRPSEHGTAIASILAGEDSVYRGVAPNAKLFAASVFFKTPTNAEAATTASLVRALDWLSGEGVHIVNMSMTGPPNAVLEAAILRANSKGMTVVAAVGNDGPAAAPRFPAAYPAVIAATAVDSQKRVYRYANRGAYVDFAAPGVGVVTAAVSGGYALRSGTSFAAPFVAVMLARSSDPKFGLSQASLDRLKHNAEDLGAPGFDPVYGNGYIHRIDDE